MVKINIYNKKLHINLEIGSVIILKKTPIRINKNLDIVLENPNEQSIEILGVMSSSEVIKLRKFRFDQAAQFDSLLELCNPVVTRCLIKLSFVIKKIISVQAMKDDIHNPIPNYPSMSLIAKVIIDDGTFEGLVWLYNTKVKDLFKISHNIMESIRLQVQTSNNVSVYDSFSNKGLLTKDNFDSIFTTKLIGYCIPYSNVTKKSLIDSSYNALFKNLSSEDSMKNRASNLVFINGDVSAENFNITNEYYLQPRPLLKLINYEMIE